MRTISIAAAATAGVLLLAECQPDSGNNPLEASNVNYKGQTRTYYVAAEPVDWNYAPDGSDPVFGGPVPSPWGDSLVYAKIRYIGYTDGSFTTQLPQPPDRGILGPVLRAAVGDSIKVVFFNRADRPLSMHPHGVTYSPENEGAEYDPPRGGGDAIPPGGTYTYAWFAEEQAGPAPGEPSSRVWLYHSHVMAEEEIYLGLVGTIVVTDKKHARPDGSPNDVDREFTTFWMVFNENSEDTPEEEQEMNLKHAINGLFFGNLHGLTMNFGETVRWYLVALGTEVDLHTPHWHGEKVLLEGRTYTDVVELLPASMKTGDMRADNPGVWLLHCHVNDHMIGGMFATFTINQANGAPPANAAVRVSDEGWFGFGDIGRVAPMPSMPGMRHP
jgi:FtsP/CotA-like multicopper oxidase with cupredoxin domain